MRTRLALIPIALLLVVAAQAGEMDHATPAARVRLLRRVVLRSAHFTLDNLLPRSAPAALHQQAAKIVLGQSPQPAASRVIYPQQLEFLLHGHAALLKRLQIPKEILIEHYYRALTKREIVKVINLALGSHGLRGTDWVDAQDVQFSTPVYVTEKDARLAVLRIASDPLEHETVFTLWTPSEPHNLPFTVTVERAVKLPTLVARRVIPPGEIVSPSDFAVEMKAASRNRGVASVQAGELAGLETRATLKAGQPVDRDLFKRPVLVEPGALATLIVEGGSFSIKTVVVPLEQGVLGQEIRVRNEETRRVVVAKVVGRDRLRKSL